MVAKSQVRCPQLSSSAGKILSISVVETQRCERNPEKGGHWIPSICWSGLSRVSEEVAARFRSWSRSGSSVSSGAGGGGGSSSAPSASAKKGCEPWLKNPFCGRFCDESIDFFASHNFFPVAWDNAFSDQGGYDFGFSCFVPLGPLGTWAAYPSPICLFPTAVFIEGHFCHGIATWCSE